MVHACGLSKADTHRWVEHQVTTRQKSKGWLSTYKSLEAQDYFLGNRLLWLPKPKSIAYKVPSNPQSRRQSTSRSKGKGRQPKQRSQKRNTNSTPQKTKVSNKNKGIWIPKNMPAQMP